MGKNVLIVEDDEETREVFGHLLSSFHSKSAASRDEALEIINSGFSPSCILMDYMMPGMSLPEFLEQAKQFKSQVVLTTAYTDAKTAADFAGVACSLQKPVPAQILIRVVEQVAGSRG